ncbi:MAG: thioredoxin fold domain-containing protein [Rikenellaceae bacterium]
MIKRFFSTLLAIVAVASLSAQVDFKSANPVDLYKMGAESGKLVFVDLYASWCPPCRTMESQVFSREDVGEFMAKRFVSAKFDIDQQIGGAMASQYGVRSIPTYLIFNGKGELVGRMQGGMSAMDFMANLTQIIEQAK